MKKIIAVGFFIGAILFLNGCSDENNKKSENILQKNQLQEVSGYIPKTMDINKKAKDNIGEAVSKENAKINEMTSFDSKDRSFVEKYKEAVITTNYGKISIRFYNADSPITVNNFLKLASGGFYNGTKFHRVISGFMIQGGDPNSKDNDWSDDGQGGTDYTLPAEIKFKNARGALATARLGDEVNPEKRSSGSQFYINTVNDTSLDGGYTVFGEVTAGMDVVDRIEKVKTNGNNHPIEDVFIQKIELLNGK